MPPKKIMIAAFVLLDILLVIVAKTAGYSRMVLSSMVHSETSRYDWYCMPRTDGQQPQKNPEMGFVYENSNGYWIGSPDEKVIYLTFDLGYENGYTEKILDTLKEQDVRAAFFVVGHYIESSPDIVKRMADEGHLVCNHSANHKDMTTLDYETFKKELTGLEDAYFELMGKRMPILYRPPAGTFSERSLKWAKELGYSTVFWSFAYVDWYTDNQPSHESAMNTIISRTHPGEVALLHGTSKTNSEILGDVIKKWKQMGYRFGTLYDLIESGSKSDPTAINTKDAKDEQEEYMGIAFTEAAAKILGDDFGLKWDTFDAKQLAEGMNIELEHGTVNPVSDITDDNPIVTMKIALAHLYEYPDYYSRLEKMEEEAMNFWSSIE